MFKPLWTPSRGWADFAPLLRGESPGAVTFVTKNFSSYVINPVEGWWRRDTPLDWNEWWGDGGQRPLLSLLGATACGVSLRWGRDIGALALTTAVVAVFAGDQPAAHTLIDPGEPLDLAMQGHPSGTCHAVYCWKQAGALALVRPTLE